jgi:hypothetical protein
MPLYTNLDRSEPAPSREVDGNRVEIGCSSTAVTWQPNAGHSGVAVGGAVYALMRSPVRCPKRHSTPW